jgi:hypothetical protein
VDAFVCVACVFVCCVCVVGVLRVSVLSSKKITTGISPYFFIIYRCSISCKLPEPSTKETLAKRESINDCHVSMDTANIFYTRLELF